MTGLAQHCHLEDSGFQWQVLEVRQVGLSASGAEIDGVSAVKRANFWSMTDW